MSSNGSLSSAQIGPALKLFQPAAGAPEFWPGMLLWSYYERRFKPRKAAVAEPRNIAQYDESLRLFCEALDGPTVAALDGNDEAPAVFRRWLSQRPGRGGRLSSNTQRKHLIAVKAVVKTLAPESDDNPFGAGLIARTPRFELPAVVRNPEIDRLSLDEISGWIAACERAAKPRWCSHERHLPRLWNQSLIVFCYNTALRAGEAVKARESWIVEREGSKWLSMPAWACKGKRNGRLVSLNAHALLAVASAPRYGQDAIFHWPHGMGYLDKCLGRLSDAARVRQGRSTRRLLHALRRACASELSRVATHSAIVEMHLGHAGNVTRDFYLERGRDLAECVAKLPQPVWRPDRDGDQMLMF